MQKGGEIATLYNSIHITMKSSVINVYKIVNWNVKVQYHFKPVKTKRWTMS